MSRESEKTEVATSFGYRAKDKSALPLEVAKIRFSGALGDHPVMKCKLASGKVFASVNVLCPNTPIALAVLGQQGQMGKLSKLTEDQKKNYSAFLVQETDPGAMKARMFAYGKMIGEWLGANSGLLEEQGVVFLQEMPNPNNPDFKDYFDAFMEGIKVGGDFIRNNQMKGIAQNAFANFVPTDAGDPTKDKFGLSVLAYAGDSIKDGFGLKQLLEYREPVTRVTEVKTEPTKCTSREEKKKFKEKEKQKEKLLAAIEAVAIGKTSKAALYEVGGQLYVNAHLDWNKPVESARLIKTAVECGAIFGGDTNIQTLQDAKISALSIGETTYERERADLLSQKKGLEAQKKTLDELEAISPSAEQREGLADIKKSVDAVAQKMRTLELQYAHSLLHDLAAAQTAHLEVVGNTLDVVAVSQLNKGKIEVIQPKIEVTSLQPQHTAGLFGEKKTGNESGGKSPEFKS